MRKSVIDYMLFSCSAVMAGGLGEVVRKAVMSCLVAVL